MPKSVTPATVEVGDYIRLAPRHQQVADIMGIPGGSKRLLFHDASAVLLTPNIPFSGYRIMQAARLVRDNPEIVSRR